MLTSALIFGGWVLDWSANPSKVWDFFYLRLACSAVDLVLLGVTFIPRAQSYEKTLFLAPIFAVAITVQLMIQQLGGYSSNYYAGLNLCILGFAITVTLTISETIAACCAVIALWLLGGAFEGSPFAFGLFFNNLFFLIGTASIAVGSTLIRNRVAEREFQSRYENRQLKELDEAKSRFFANASHELRTPLVSLNSTVQLMLEHGVEDPTEQRLLISSKHALDDMLDNVNDILMKTKSGKGQLTARWSEVEIAPFLNQALDLFRPLVQKRGLDLDFENAIDETTSAYIDRKFLKKIINNLVGNAIKFTERGSVTVSARADASHWHLSVTDTGKGIPAEDLDEIFDAFVQASNNQQRDVQGTGLGLALVRDLVELQSGTVRATSEVGVGSCFTVSLPMGSAHVDFDKLDASEITEERDDRIDLKIRNAQEIDLSPFSKHTAGRANVLVVEDNPQVLQVLAYALADAYNLFFAHDGAEGIERVRELKPDLVVSDVMMPRKNGYELAKEVKQDPQLRNIPVVLLTSKGDMESRIAGYEHGADEYLAKPFNHRELIVRLRGLIERKKIIAESVHSEKLVALGTLAAGMAHEINNPATCINGTTPILEKTLNRLDQGSMELNKGLRILKEGIEDIHESGRRIAELTLALKGYVHPGAGAFSRYDLEIEIDKTLKLLRAGNHAAKIDYEKNYGLSSEVECNASHLNQVWMNLLQNAVDALEGVANAKIAVRTQQDETYVYVSVEDNGPGIPEAHQGAIFDLFFTTKTVGKGTGMGLYLSQRIVEEHGGLLRLECQPGLYTRFIVQIPLHQRGLTPDNTLMHESTDRSLREITYPRKRLASPRP